MPKYTVMFDFYKSPQSDKHKYEDIDAISKIDAIEYAKKKLSADWPNDASKCYTVECEQQK